MSYDDNCFALQFLENLRVNLLLIGFELRPHVILLANENELSRGRMIFVLQEVMHAKPEILQAEFAKVFASDCEWIEIVFLKVSSKLAAAFLVFPPNEADRQKEQRYNDRRDDIATEVALQRVDHVANTSLAAVATSLR